MWISLDEYPMLDIRTLIISYIATNLVCASVMALLWLQNRQRFAGIGFWLGNYVAIFTGFVLVALRGVAPDFLSIVIANALIVGGVLLLYIGLERFVGQPSSHLHDYLLLAVFVLVHAYFTFLHPSLLARNINVSVGLFIFAFEIVWLIFRRLDPDTAADLRGMGIIALLFCLFNLAHVIADLNVDPGTDFLNTNTDAIAILFYQVLQIAIALNLFLLVNRRLVVDLESDIVERQRAEEAARAGEALYHQMFAAHSAIKLLIAPETGAIVEANRAAVNFYGYPAAVLEQMNIEQINVLASQEIAKLRQGIKTGSISSFSVPHQLASGEVREVEVNSAPIEVNGRTLLYSIIHDITERKQAEEALQESEARYRAVSQSASDAIISANSAGNVVGWNRSAEVIFGWSEAEVLNQSLTRLMPAHFHAEHVAGMARVLSGGEKHIIGKTVEVHGLRKDGSEFPLEMSLSEWQVEDHWFYTAIIRDITRRKQAGDALRQTQTKVVEQQRTVATLEERERVARELHDGLGQILGYVNVQAQAAHTLVGSHQLEAAQKNLEGLVQVVQDAHANLRHTILGLRGSVSLQRNFYQALQAYLESFRQAWGIETLFSLPRTELPGLPAAVEDQLLHIVQEALVNIRKHANARRVEVIITARPGELTLIISDNGQGFDPQQAPSADQEHFGLSIMRERAEQVGGQLEIRSVIGRGTQVFVAIPTLSLPASPDHPQDAYSLRILLVDDQPLFLDGMRNLLKTRGLTVIGTAHDGLDAIEQVAALRPDVVLMDVNMPRCDGIETTRRIKAEFPETKVVLLTVSEDEEHLLDAIKYGASSYLLKNLDANQLLATLDGLARGEIQLAPAVAARLLAEFNRAGTAVQLAADGPDAIPGELTMRQWEVLRLVARGLTYKEAGRELHVTEQAIKYHMAQVLDRLQVKNREQAIAYLRQVETRTQNKGPRPHP